MDATTLRAEIKAWERTFKQKHQREPTVQDIKEQPVIADKYKLYKKLNKALTSSQTADPPSTPPRRTPASQRPASIVPKSRAAPSTAPPSAVNPFSPVKDRGKDRAAQIARPHSARNYAPLPPNPFATPIKNKGKTLAKPRDPSPDPFPLILSLQEGISSQEYVHSNTGITKARKRLHGDPVSPSPRGKDKRRRVDGSPLKPMNTHLDFGSNRDLTDDDDIGELNSSYVVDSPVKPAAGGKDFKLLFDESHQSNGRKTQTRGIFPSSRPDIFHEKGLMSAISCLDDETELALKAKKINLGVNVPRLMVKREKSKGLVPRGIIPGRDDMGSGPVPSSSSESNAGKSQEEPSHQNAGMKRALSSDNPHADPQIDLQEEPTSRSALLPPSPPPQEPSMSKSGQYHGKGKNKVVSRKRVRLEKELGNGEDSPEEDINIKIIDWKPRVRSQLQKQVSSVGHANTAHGWDSDSVLRLDARHKFAPSMYDFTDGGEDAEEGAFDIDLPDNIRKTLALSPSRPGDRKEKALVRSILYGDKAGHHSSGKGAEVWDAGEIEDAARGSDEGEDDWAGEGVPWEVGEL